MTPHWARMRKSALTAVLVLAVAACGNGTPPPDTGEEGVADAPSPAAPDDPGDDEPDDPGDDDPEPVEDPADPTDDPDQADGGDVEVEVTDVATGLDAPWDVAFLEGRAFVTQRDTGEVLEIDDGNAEAVATFDVDATSEGGLLGLTAGPDAEWLYAYYTGAQDNRIVRFHPDDDAEPEVVFEEIPAAATHNGGRILFGPDDQLYVGTGDAQDEQAAQDPSSLAGKILRLTPDGEVPDDNPTDGSPVYSLGHRNVQGLAFDPDGTLYASEFGPEVDDEVNLIEPGGNYGWPEVTGAADHPDYLDPIFVRQPDEGSWSGLALLTDGAMPEWEGDLFLASLRGERMWRMGLDGGQVADDEEFWAGEYGRLRQVKQAPDGELWVLTNNTDGRGEPAESDDRILRLGPPE